MDIANLAKRDKAIRQITEHLDALDEVLHKNMSEINNKEKTNKYLTTVKTQFNNYEKSVKNINKEQIRIFNVLKQNLLNLLNDTNIDETSRQNIDDDLTQIENELAKLNKRK